MRIVSLVPSVTESLLAWGVVPVAVTRFCEQPGFATVGGTKDPDLDAIRALAPDLVVVDEEENRREDHDALVAAGVPVHVTAVRAVADVPDMLAALAERVGATFDRSTHRREPVGAVGRRRRVFVPIWKRPWMSLNADTYGSSMLTALGFVNVLAERDERYPTVTLDAVATLRPDLVILPTEPYPFAERHRADLAPLGVPVVVVDGRDLFWWGTRTADALTRLGAALG